VSLKKLQGYDAKLIKEILKDEDSVIEIDDKKYVVSLIEKPKIPISDESENKPRKKVQQMKLDILNGKEFAIDDVVEMMDQGKL